MKAVEITLSRVEKTVTKTETNYETTSWGGAEMVNGLFGRDSSESTRTYKEFSHTLVEIKMCDDTHSEKVYEELFQKWDKANSMLWEFENIPQLPKKLVGLRVGNLLTTNESSKKTCFTYEEQLIPNTYYIPIHFGMGGWYFKNGDKALHSSSTYHIEGEFSKRGVTINEVYLNHISEDLMCLIEEHLDKVDFFDKSFDNRYSVDKTKKDLPKPKRGQKVKSLRHENKLAGHNPFEGLADMLK